MHQLITDNPHLDNNQDNSVTYDKVRTKSYLTSPLLENLDYNAQPVYVSYE